MIYVYICLKFGKSSISMKEVMVTPGVALVQVPCSGNLRSVNVKTLTFYRSKTKILKLKVGQF